MKKSLIALAVAGAFAAPAFAASSNVDIAGQMHLSLDSLASKTTTAGTKTNVSSNASNLIFKGAEDLGGGMNAFYQIQTYFSAGGTGNSDTSFGGSDGIGSGNTFVGLGGGFGKVLLGKTESPAKLMSRKVDLFNNQIGDTRNLTSTAKGSGAASADPGFDLRPNNVAAYASPDLSGFNVLLAYVTNVGSTAAVAPNTTGNLNAVNAWSGNVSYTNGPLFVGAAYEEHADDKAVANYSKTKESRLAASYTIGDLKGVAYYQHENGLYYSATQTNQSRNVWGLGAAYGMGPITLKAQYYQADKVSGTSDTNAKMWDLGADYALSKRTTTYLAYAQTNNKANAMYSAFGGGHGDNPGTVAGAKPSGVSIGMIHNF